MTDEGRTTIFTQLEAVKNHYLTAIEKLASDIERHYRNQKRCDESGEEPEYKRSQRKATTNKLRREAKQQLDATAMVRQPVKKPTKKRGA